MNKKRILVIEDDVDLLANLKLLLIKENYEVFTSANGKAGIENAKELLPDLIICDVLMPLANGYEVLEVLSKSKKTRSIPFIFLTAKVERSDIRLGMVLGADDYLFKPFERMELLDAIKSRLSKREMIIADHVDEEKDSLKGKKKKEYDLEDKLFITVNGAPSFITINEIKYISTLDHYTLLKLTNGKSIFIHRTIKNWEGSLPKKTFLRIHRCTIINMSFIVKMERWHNASMIVFLKDVKEPFIISKTYSTKIREQQK